MANPLKILTVLTASQAVKMEQGLDVNSQKITSIANATESTDAVAYGQLTEASGAIKSYVDAQDSALSSSAAAALTAFSGAAASALTAEAVARAAADAALSSSLKTYIDAENAAQDVFVDTISSSLKAYVDAGDATLQGNLDAVSGAMKSYVDAADATLQGNLDAVSGALKTYIDAGDAEVQANLDAVSGALVTYIDSENAAQDAAVAAMSGAFKAYIDAADSDLVIDLGELSSSLKGYVDAQDTAISGAFDSRITALSGAAATAIAAEAAARAAADSALSSSLKSYVDAADTQLQSNLDAVSGAMKSYVDAENAAQDVAVDNLSSSLKAYVDAADTVLSGAIVSEAAARVAEDLTFLKLDGSRAMVGALDMGGYDVTNAKSGSFSGDVTVGGNLQVNGQLTYINSVNLEVTDATITIAKGAANAAAADGAGIEVDGANASFTYDAAGDKWVSNKDLQVQGDATVDADLFISGASDFSYITGVSRDGSGLYDVDAAIQALDVAVSGAVNAGSADLTSLKNKYDALRCVVTGTLSSGTVTVNLSTEGGAQFVAAELANLALDVMMNDGTGYTNDLVAIKMFVDGSDVKVQIDAPATPSGAFRLIAVNEKDGGLN